MSALLSGISNDFRPRWRWGDRSAPQVLARRLAHWAMEWPANTKKWLPAVQRLHHQAHIKVVLGQDPERLAQVSCARIRHNTLSLQEVDSAPVGVHQKGLNGIQTTTVP